MTIYSDIDKVFNKGLADYSERTPSFIWGNIEQELKSKKSKTKRLTFYAIAASAALLLSFGAGYMFKHKNNNTQFANLQTEIVTTINTNEPETKKPKNNTPQVITEPKQNKTVSQPILQDDTNEKDLEPNDEIEETKNQKPASKVKKASSSGTLLPPMYANQSNFESNNESTLESESTLENEKIATKETMSLKTLIRKSAKMGVPEQEKNLVYDLREMPMVPFEHEDVKPVKKYDSWAVGISGTPLLSYRNVQTTNSESFYSSVNTSGLQQEYNNEKPLLSFSAGVNVNYNLTSRWAIQSGLYFSETGQIVEDIYFDQNPSASYNSSNTNYLINTSVGNIEINNPQDIIASKVSQASDPSYELDNAFEQDGAIASSVNTQSTGTDFVQTLEYYELPLIVNYKMIDRKFDVKLAGGFSANFLSENSIYLQDGDNRQDIDAELSNIKNTTYSTIIGLGLEYPIISQLLLNLSPTFRYSISSINSSSNTHPYSFGIYTGLKYSF